MSLRENLKKHIASIHEDEKPYKCAICDYKCSEKGNSFVEVDNFTCQITSAHEKKKSFKCSICHYKSFHEESLSLHNTTIHREKVIQLFNL